MIKYRFLKFIKRLLIIIFYFKLFYLHLILDFNYDLSYFNE